jgi:hypothetical protein
LYGAQSWNLTEGDKERLAVFERKILRAIFGPVKEGGNFRTRYNHELYQLFQEPDIVMQSSLLRLKWAGHVVRREPNHPLMMCFRGKFLDGRRKRGRPKISWMDTVDSDSASFGIRDWQRKAMDKNKFHNSLFAAMARPRVMPAK